MKIQPRPWRMAGLHRNCKLPLVFLHHNRQLFSSTPTNFEPDLQTSWPTLGSNHRGLESEFVVRPTTAPQENLFSNHLPWEVCQRMQTWQIMQEQGRFGISRCRIGRGTLQPRPRLASCAQTQAQQRFTSCTIQILHGKITASLIQNHKQLHREQQQLGTTLNSLKRQSNKTTHTPDSVP